LKRRSAKSTCEQKNGKHGFKEEGGQLLNMRNEIDPEEWEDYGIEDIEDPE
jgi:hypothetical protein